MAPGQGAAQLNWESVTHAPEKKLVPTPHASAMGAEVPASRLCNSAFDVRRLPAVGLAKAGSAFGFCFYLLPKAPLFGIHNPNAKEQVGQSVSDHTRRQTFGPVGHDII